MYECESEYECEYECECEYMYESVLLGCRWVHERMYGRKKSKQQETVRDDESFCSLVAKQNFPNFSVSSVSVSVFLLLLVLFLFLFLFLFCVVLFTSMLTHQ